MKILVIGSKGQLGRCLCDSLDQTNFEIVFSNSNQINIEHFRKVEISIESMLPDIVINASAYTAVDLAESNKVQANILNHLAVKNLAQVCSKLDIIFIHISTDYVFDGLSTKFYNENCPTNPQSTYGHSKLLGEKSIISSGTKHIIIRTSWLFSEYGSNFLKTMVSLAVNKNKNKVGVVSNQVGTPTYAHDLSSSINKILLNIKAKKAMFGLFHYAGNSSCSWYEFASFIFKELNNINPKYITKACPINSTDYPTPAQRPINSCLDSNKICLSYNINPSDWQKGVIKTINKIL